MPTFMGRQEETFCEAFIWAIPFWKGFIDDIFLIFLGTTNQLQSLQDFMNHLHPTIKFTFQYFTQQISFLDIKIQVGANRKLFITLYRKSTDCASLLHFHSNHSFKCKESIVFHNPSDTTSSLQMITYYKKNSIPSQYLALPENTH